MILLFSNSDAEDWQQMAIGLLVSTEYSQAVYFSGSFIDTAALQQLPLHCYVFCPMIWYPLIGASVSEPHTSLFYCDFSYIIYFLVYVVPYLLDAVI